MRRLFLFLLFSLLLFSCATLDRNYGSFRAQGVPVLNKFPDDQILEEGWAAIRMAYEDIVFDVVVWDAEAGQTELVLYQNRERSRLIGRLERAIRLTESRERQVILAANAGMYDDDLLPVGLYREAGEELFPLNRDAGEGNFGLKPNGVFYFDDRGFGVTETSEYAALSAGAEPAYATQSGPLLLQAGSPHPAFSENSVNYYVRSGVGVQGAGFQQRLFFVISEEPVTFMILARFFRDRLGCTEALYLDGHTSRAYIPGLDREQTGGPFGPILLVSFHRAESGLEFSLELNLQYQF